ncbi:uncharacterized protein EI97DRAFT_372856 [Westerdykella ornata]|uniref:Uncharacterized protein n=1 Tax=Westerdykella ornata TaxID=318751 RepID=A0A6A6JQC2_WESOR|nr:uncharacterized protein EI97DRAFT_372856 [Westerdykella ornata]KAF2278098.1 hypothetical protein EI97DRAFT_372856 [Westerdykella ornata]
MKYTTAILALAVGALALPQEASTITSAPVSAASVTFTPQQSCAMQCDPADVTCRAQCFGVARPNTSQVLETNECASKCDQGSGSPEDTKKYGECLLDCYAKYFPSTQTLTPGGNGNAAPTTTGTGANTPTGTNGQPTGSGSAAGSKPTGAANVNGVQLAGVGFAGFAGFVMALFAL